MYTQKFSISDDGEVVGVRKGGLLTTIYFIGGRLEGKRARADQKQVQHRHETKTAATIAHWY
jgi:hypothetical protein